MSTVTRALQVTALLLFMLAGASGCNTMAGMGQDVQDAGEALEESAS